MKKGRIINIISNLFLVEIEDKIYECNSRGLFKNKEEKPVVGDIVNVDISNHQNTILEILDRKLYCKRPKIANLTQLLCVVSAKDPKPDLLMLDKQLVFAEYLGVRPVIIINKKDLDSQETSKITKIYSQIGYQVITSNAKDLKQNMNELKEILRNNISAFSGNSGVGKSTLINRLIGIQLTNEGEISKKNKKGKNTTTSIRLYKIENNTYIADTPGFSTFDLQEIPSKDLYRYFIEFCPYIKQCEFLDCMHIKEAHCGIKQEIGKNISSLRYHHYQKIFEELKEREEHQW